jgi:purine-cytosine permease-like protein
LCFVNLPGQFVGPLGELAGGIDISLPVTLGLASVVYLVLLGLFPEPAAVYGPGDPRSKGAAEPIDKPSLSQTA